MIPESVAAALLTVFIGVVVYALGQIFSNFVIEPIHKQDEIRGEIADSLVFYADVYSNPKSSTMEERERASRDLRQKATLLTSRTYVIRGYRFLSWVGVVPKKEDVFGACRNLIALSNSVFAEVHPSETYQWAEEIKRLLKLI